MDQMPGLIGAKKAVSRLLSKGSNVHAVLLYGPEGAGKTALAQYLAKSWLCPSPAANGMACGECPVCNTFELKRAVDFQNWYPWGPAAQIKLSAMRPTSDWQNDKERPPLEFVMHFFRTRPLMARNKVILFRDAHRLNSDTANAFLKTLEEPSASSKIILTTSEFSRVLPTIRSRCMCLACELPSKESASLADEYFSPVESVFGGSPGGVAHIKEHAASFQDLYDLLESSLVTPYGAAFLLAEKARNVSEKYAKSAGLTARAANIKIVEAIATWITARCPGHHTLQAQTAETHRLLLGNGQAGPLFEVLFLELLYHMREQDNALSV